MERGTDGYYHLLYKTINLINGHFYIGVHSTRILEDGYLGSGTRLKAEISKYGKENFKREILEYRQDKKSLYLREKEIVNEELRQHELCLNLVDGGVSGGDFSHLNDSSITHIQRAKKAAIRSNQNIEKRRKSSDRMRILSKKRHSLGLVKYGNFQGKTHTEKTIEKQKVTFKEIGHQQGEKNSQFGKCWIYHELIGSKKCKKELLPEYLEQGWVKGRKMKHDT